MERWTREAHRQLRVAIRASSSVEAVELLRSHRVVDTAHTINGWLISSIATDVPGARWLATTMVDGLSNTGLPGDDALVGRLQHALDGTAPTDLTMIPVDMSVLTEILEGNPDDLDDPASWVNVTTGEILWAEPDDLDEEPPGVGDVEAWLEIVPYWPPHGWQDMADFIGTVDDAVLAERLSNAIRGRGAFRYFKDVVYSTEHEGHRWNLFSEERQLGRARAWLADHGLRPD